MNGIKFVLSFVLTEPGVPYSCIVFFETNIDTPVNDDEEIIFFSKELGRFSVHV